MKRSARHRALRALDKYVKAVRDDTVYLMILKVILVPLGLVPPFLYKIMLDHVMTKLEMRLLPLVFCGYLMAFLLSAIIEYKALRFSKKVSKKFALRIRQDIWEKCFRLDIKALQQMEVGNLKRYLDEDVAALENFVEVQGIDYYISIVSLCVYVGILFLMNIPLSVIAILIIPFTLGVGEILSQAVEKVNFLVREAYMECDSWIISVFQNWKGMKGNNIEEQYSDYFQCRRCEIAKLDNRKMLLHFLELGFYDMKNNVLCKFVLYFCGAYLVWKNMISIGTLLVFVQCFSKVTKYVDIICDSNIRLKTSLPSLLAIQNFMDLANENEKYTGISKTFDGTVQICNVSYQYHKDGRYILSHISYSLQEGKKIAIVGRSGCGKSTLIKLIMGILAPVEGEILYGTAASIDFKRYCNAKDISVIMQEPFLFNMSVRENLALVEMEATDLQMKDACQKVGLWDYIEERGGLDYIIGTGGARLSGGQRQRLALVRILLLKPMLAIFDEATSALDAISERKIISELMKELNSGIFITHRLTTITSVDEILVMGEGRILDCGPHDKLIKECETYKILYEISSCEEEFRIAGSGLAE